MYNMILSSCNNCFLFNHLVEYLAVVGALLLLFLVMRKQFKAVFNNIHDNIEVIEPFDANAYKSRLCQIYFEYQDFRNLVDGWTTFVLAFGVLGITTQISYMYAFNESKYSSNAQLKHKVTTYTLS